MSSIYVNPPTGHIAVCAFPYGTHAAPLLLLTKRLSIKAPNIRFTFFNLGTSNASLFKANDNVNEFKNIVPYNITIPKDEESVAIKVIELFIESAPESFARAMAEAEAEVKVQISCVISDAFLWFFGDVAEEKGLCWIPLWTAAPVSLSSHFYTDVIRSHFRNIEGAGVGQDPLVECVPGLSNIRIRDLPMGVVSGDLNSPFSSMLHKMSLNLHKSSAVVLNGFDELSPIVTNDLKSHMKLLCVGPFPLTTPCSVQSDPHECIAWLDKREPKQVAYISFGTVATPPTDELNALAEALIESKTPFLWSMKDSIKANLTPEFLEKIEDDENFGKIVPWAPQMKVLAHPAIGVFVTQCGWNSITESLVNGVPLICRPFLGDQALNQRSIECDMKLGTGMEGGCFTKEGTISALEKVLVSDEGKVMRKNAEALKELAEESVKPDGSSSDNFSTLLELVTSSQKTQ